jgi:acyl-CoA dehydrogenase
MDFSLDEEHRLIKQSVKQIASDYGDEYWRRIRQQEEFPTEIYEDLAKEGWLSLLFPQEYGGQEMGMFELVLVMEALGEEDAWEAANALVLPMTFGGLGILKHGTEDQKDEYLPGIINGDHFWAGGITEPDSGLNTANISTVAEFNGDKYVINGQKQFISGIHDAHRLLLLARIDESGEDRPPHEGLTMFIVDPSRDGIEYNEIPLDIYWPEKTYQVHINDLEVDEESILGTKGDGLKQIFSVLNPERITTAAISYCVGLKALNQAVEYAKNREVWSAPIGSHQAIQFPLADAYSDLELAKMAIRAAAWKYDHGMDGVGEISNIANLQAGKGAWNACEAAMTTFGGMSVSADLDIAALWQVVRHYRIAPVSEEMIRNYIGQHVLGLPRSY